MKTILTACLGASAAIFAATSWTSGAAAQQEIGDVELVRVWATGTPPESTRRDLVVEDQVFRNESVETVRDGALHLRFLDDTEFRLGSNSRAVLDSFVYDSDTDSGEIALTLSKGLFRYVSGKLKGEKITIKTPTATVGLRGTVVTIFVGPDGETIVDVDDGEAFLRALNSDAVRAITAATQMAKVDRDGKVSSFDGKLPKDSGLKAKGGHEGRAGMKTSNTGRGVKSRLGRGSASNGQTVSALSPESVLDRLSQKALASQVSSVVAVGPDGLGIVGPDSGVRDEVDQANADDEEFGGGGGGGGSGGDITLEPVRALVSDLQSPSQEGVVYEDVFASQILATDGNQGDKVDYALIGNFPDQSGFLDDVGIGQGLEGTIKLVTVPDNSTVLAFGAPSDFTYQVTGKVDRGASGIPGQVVVLDPDVNNPIPIFRKFDLEVGQTATLAVNTTRDRGTVVSVISDGSAPWSRTDSSR